MKKLKTLSLLFLLSLSANMLTAQTWIATYEEEEEIVETEELGEVVIIVHPRSVSWAHLRNVERFTFTTPADVAQRTPGVSLTRDGVWATSVNIRGLSNERILMLVDGVRIQTSTDISGAMSTVDLHSLSRVEVIRGASSVIYGTGAMGGVVRFISDRPRYTENLTTSGRVGTGFSTVNNLWTNHARFQVSEDNWFFSANGSYRRAQNTQTPAGVLENSQFEDWSFGVQAGMMIGDRSPHQGWQELLVNYQRFEARNVGISGGPFPDMARVRYLNMNRNLLSGEYIFHNPTFNLNKLRLKAYTQNISRDVENRIETQNLTILPSSFNVTNGAKITADWNLFWRNSLITGIEGWQRQAETRRVRIREIAERRYEHRVEQPIPDATMLNLGVFAQHHWNSHRPRNFEISTGLRFDHIRVQNDSVFDPVAVFISGEEQNIERNLLFASGTSNEFSYSAHIDFVYQPNRAHRFALSLSKAHRTASLEERFRFIDLGTMLQVGNPNLQPEQGGFSNFSYWYKFQSLRGRGFILETNIFANYLFNMITATIQPFQKPDGNPVQALVNTNIGEAFLAGADVHIRYWTNSQHFWVIANAGYTRARDVQNNEYLPQIPPLHGMLELNYRLPSVPLIVSTSANFSARQWQTARGEQETAGFVVLNANISSESIPINSTHLQFSAGVDNILNTTYFNHLRTTRMGFAQAEPGRNFYVRAQFGW